MKEKLYLFAGVSVFQIGACAIHWGLGLMTIGAVFIVCSYIEFDERYKNNYKEEEKKYEEATIITTHGYHDSWM